MTRALTYRDPSYIPTHLQGPPTPERIEAFAEWYAKTDMRTGRPIEPPQREPVRVRPPDPEPTPEPIADDDGHGRAIHDHSADFDDPEPPGDVDWEGPDWEGPHCDQARADADEEER